MSTAKTSSNKYVSLVKNVSIFAAGTLGSKLIMFFMLPFYTSRLSPELFAVSNLITDTANLLIPIITVSVIDGVIRYALDKAADKRAVFSTGLLICALGFGAFLLLSPIALFFDDISQYVWLLCVFIFCSIANNITSHFTRAIGFSKRFAYGGFQNTVLVVLFNLLFLLVFNLGPVGYVLSIALADLLSAIFFFVSGKLWRFVVFKFDRKLILSMAAFSVPLIPNALFWWINAVSDRYIIVMLMGAAATGIYVAAGKIPAVIMMVSNVFMQAFQISAISQYDEADRGTFYARVFNIYQALLFMAGSFIILLSQIIIRILVASEYQTAWMFVPFLIMAVIFQCFCNYMGSIFIAAKLTRISMITTIAGALINIVLNFALIPVMGQNGAALATFVSFFFIFFPRLFLIKRRIELPFHLFSVWLNLIIISVQALLVIFSAYFSLWWLPCGGLSLLMLLFNGKSLFTAAKTLLSGKFKRKNNAH